MLFFSLNNDFRSSSLYVINIIIISLSKFFLFFWFCPIDIIIIHCISNKFRWIWLYNFKWWQLILRIQRILRYSICLKFYTFWLTSFYIYVWQICFCFVMKNIVQCFWLWSKNVTVIIEKLRFINCCWCINFWLGSYYLYKYENYKLP